MSERYLRRKVLVLHAQDRGEADRLLTALSAEEGLLFLLARGIRRPKAKLQGTLQPLSLVDVTFYKGRWRTVTGALPLRSWRHLKESYEGLTAAQFMAELLAKTTPREADGGAFWELALTSLDILERGGPPALTALRFARDLLGLHGWGVDFRHCAVCGRDLRGEAFLRPHLGMATHGACAAEGMGVDGATLRALGSDGLPEGSERGVLEVLLALWQGHLGERLKTAPSLRRILPAVGPR